MRPGSSRRDPAGREETAGRHGHGGHRARNRSIPSPALEIGSLSGDLVVAQLIEIGHALASRATLEDRMSRVLGQATELLGCDRCSVMLWDGVAYRATYNFGNPPDVSEEFLSYTVPPHAPLVEQAHRTGEFVVVNSAKQHPTLASIAKHANIESIVIVPMQDVGGERFGFLTAEFNEHVGVFSRIQAQATAAISSLVGSALISARDRRERAASDEDRRRMLAELSLAEQRERQRISADIHDDVLQRVTSVAHFLEILGGDIDDPELRSRVARLEHETRSAGLSLRRVVEDLFPVGVDSVTLRSALVGLIERTESLTDATVSLRVVGSREPTLEQAAALYRIAQQALDNVVAHARSDRVEVSVDFADDEVRLTVVDNGVGFERGDVVPGRIGLFSMTQRAEHLGGTCVIDSVIGHGTTVIAVLPTD